MFTFETSPPVAARMSCSISSYDLVEQMLFLYVRVVKARDLPSMDITGSLDPYVEVKFGKCKGFTNHLEKNQNPAWNIVFALTKERLHSSVLEVYVKDNDTAKDDFVGRVLFDVNDVPLRVPPDSPLPPQWYKLEDNKGLKTTMPGEIMLAVWMGTQADEAFPDAWHSDAHGISRQTLANMRSEVYIVPNLYYLRIHVIEAQDLIFSEKGQPSFTSVKIQVGNQDRATRPAATRTNCPVWNEELMFVVAEPLDEQIIISVDDKGKIIGRLLLAVRYVPKRVELAKLSDGQWFNLLHPSEAEEEGDKKKEFILSSKIHLQLCIDAGYHVLHESKHFSRDLQPSSELLRKPNIGILDLGILGAQNLLPMESKDGRTTNTYCLAKYGRKWVRTRTLVDTLTARWNEQYAWEVYDPYTVITIGVFDNCNIDQSEEEAGDRRIGKVRIRLSTLETNRTYVHCYPLLVLGASGLKKHGDLHLAIRFRCTTWVNMVKQYGRPLLPNMHYVQPLSAVQVESLCFRAMQIVVARLSKAEQPLRKEAVEYMLDRDYEKFSLRRSKANFARIESLLSGILAVYRWFNDICQWRNPLITILVHVLFFIQVQYPAWILPNFFVCLFVIGLWNYRFRPRHPLHLDARLSLAVDVDEDEVEEELDSYPTSEPIDVVRVRYDRLRSVAGHFLMIVGDLATIVERAHSLLSWRDPRATATVAILALFCAVFLKVTPFQVVAQIIGLYWLRHPCFRSKLPSVAVNLFNRMPAKSDMLL